ncbi:uncharacterized protein [Dendropsophus ebraccatus]|uniref:uncharacterized protein isoform X3 n=1 Tax=Dendropsophus ebraccatus TaxID=150705 RepID=UPI003831A5A4
MDRHHSFPPLGCSMMKPGVMVKTEEELYEPQGDGCPSAGYSMMNSEIIIKEERSEDNLYSRCEEMFEEEEEESPESSSSNDYIVVKIKEEEEEERPYGMDYQPPGCKGSRPQTWTAGREKYGRHHKMSSKMVIDIDQLIRMVHDRPELYDPKVPSYADRYKKKKAWDEICTILVPDWDLCSEGEKHLKAKEIQTRWRSLKDCFRRELTLQKKLEKSGIPANRRRKYVHYNGLLFLEPTMRLRDSSDVTLPTTSNISESVEDLHPIELDSESPSPRPPPRAPPASKRMRKKAVTTSESEWETHLLNVMNNLKKRSEERSDPDKTFLRSLLPFVKKVPDERKIDLQLSLMQVVKEFMKPPSHQKNSTHMRDSHQPPTSPLTPAIAPNSAQPYSSPSSSINPSPRSHIDSPYYSDL